MDEFTRGIIAVLISITRNAQYTRYYWWDLSKIMVWTLVISITNYSYKVVPCYINHVLYLYFIGKLKSKPND